LIEAWAQQAEARTYGDNDEAGLSLALGSVHGISIMNLDETRPAA
jgi:hypothetical protein